MNKNAHVSFRCTDAEKWQIQHEARKAGITVSAFLLQLARIWKSLERQQREKQENLSGDISICISPPTRYVSDDWQGNFREME